MSSFILNFKKKKNFFLGLIYLILISYIFLFIFIKIFQNYSYPTEVKLYKNHLNKISERKYTNIIFGDSSAGNSINSLLWEDLTKEKTLNLALWGTINFKGHLHLIDQINLQDLKKIIIITGIDVWMRNSDTSSKEIKNLKKYKNKDKIFFPNIKQIKNIFLGKKIIDNYVEQDKKKVSINYYKKLDPNNINKDNLLNLKKIFKICEDNGINCIHLNGPISSKMCKTDEIKNYLNKIYLFFDKYNINHKKDVVCIKNNDLGDSWDHPKPSLKKKYTKIFFELINN
jgi:hypothetical protein